MEHHEEEEEFQFGRLQAGKMVSNYAIRLLWEVQNGSVELDNRIVFIGDSNLRDAYEICSSFDILKSYHQKFTICAKGGRRLSHLPELFPSVANFKYICILLGGNHLITRSVDEMLNDIAEFKYHLPATWPKPILCFRIILSW